MSLAALLKVIPPPAAPFEAFSGPWEPVETELGSALPEDYKDFVRVYGSGYFMQFLGVNVPRSSNPNARLEHVVREVSAIFADLDEQPYRLWPELGGLVPFGSTDNGDFMFWLPRQAPAEWVVVIWDRGMGDFEEFDCGLTDFLAGVASGDLVPRAFPDDFTPENRTFEPSFPVP